MIAVPRRKWKMHGVVDQGLGVFSEFLRPKSSAETKSVRYFSRQQRYMSTIYIYIYLFIYLSCITCNTP